MMVLMKMMVLMMVLIMMMANDDKGNDKHEDEDKENIIYSFSSVFQTSIPARYLYKFFSFLKCVNFIL